MNAARDKRKVAIGILVAWLLALSFITAGLWIFQPAKMTAQHALAFTLTCAALPLAAGIGWAARLRHFSSNIDGSKPTEGSALDITLRFVTNTSEQSLLLALAAIGFFISAPGLSSALLPVMGVWYMIARALFYIGYRLAPLWRSIGFAGSFHPTLALLVLTLWTLLN